MSLSTSIRQTLVYADIFDFPLTIEELHRFLINSQPINLAKIEKVLAPLVTAKKVVRAENFYCLPYRKKIVLARKKRRRWNRQKRTLARRAASWLKLIPTIKMVAITGALAMNNAKKDDDIDLLIVAAKGRLWLTRLLAVLLVELAAQRRRPRDKQAKDKLCLNMLLEEGHLKVPPSNQDLFTAHEVVQLKPLWSRDGVDEKFMTQNQWTRHYLPNAAKRQEGKVTRGSSFRPASCLFDWLEKLVYRLQLAYMNPRRTIEIVQPHRIHFRLHDHRGWVLNAYQEGCRQHGLANRP